LHVYWGAFVSTVLARLRDEVRWFHDTRDARFARDLLLLIVRVALVWIFVYHGASTLFGAFHGAGIHGEALYFSTVVHLQPATFFAVLDGFIQFFGGVAVGLGVFGRIAAASIADDMIMAMITVTFAQGLTGNAVGVGYQLNLSLVALALVVAFLGTGRFSLDAMVQTLMKRRRGRLTIASAPTPQFLLTGDSRDARLRCDCGLSGRWWSTLSKYLVIRRSLERPDTQRRENDE